MYKLTTLAVCMCLLCVSVVFARDQGALLTVFCTFLVTDGLSLSFFFFCLSVALLLCLSVFSLLAFSVYRSSSSPHAPADSTDTSDWLCGQDAGEQ